MQYERMQNEIIDFNNIDLSEIKEALIHFNSIFEDSLIFLKFKERYKEVESKFNDNDHQLILSDLLNYE